MRLWSMYFKGDSDGINKDGPTALSYASKACELDLIQGCVNALIMCQRGDGVPKDIEQAKKFSQKVNELKKAMSDPGVVFGETHKNLD